MPLDFPHLQAKGGSQLGSSQRQHHAWQLVAPAADPVRDVFLHAAADMRLACVCVVVLHTRLPKAVQHHTCLCTLDAAPHHLFLAQMQLLAYMDGQCI
jgi:hypothetical protein